MTETLRPMNLGGILDRGVQIFRAQYLLFFGLGIIPGIAQVAWAVASVHPKKVDVPTAGHAALVAASYGSALVLWVVHLVLGAITSAAVCLAASRINLGEEVTVRSAFGAFKSKGGRLVGLSFLQGLYAGWPFIIVIVIAVFIAGAAGSSASSLYLLAPIYVLGAIPCVALYARYALAFPASAIENLPAQSAIQRSISLSEGGKWRICLGFLVPLLPTLMLTLGSAGVIGHFRLHSSLLAASPFVVAGINGAVYLIAALVFHPYSAIVLTLLYYDQRIRREGYDVERMMDAAGLNTASPMAPASPWTQINAEDGQG
jgi:hypothetical protein